jgi:uncharacterized SAM-binding protein YcdF (DUF218 family)
MVIGGQKAAIQLRLLFCNAYTTAERPGAERNGVKRSVFRVAGLLLALLLGYLLYVAKQIERVSVQDEARPADVIVVLGAAEYRGRPSPVLQARLNHALLLYLRDLAPYILTTGGAGGDPRFTEGEVGRDYLINHGVPSEDILVEPAGSTTAQSLSAAVEIMHTMDLHSCIVVSDGYHIYRVKRFLQAHGIRVFGSPRPSTAPASWMGKQWLYFRQAVAFVLWQINVSY